MAFELNTKDIKAVLVDAGWVNVKRIQPKSILGPFKWPNALEIETDSGWLYLPASSVLGVRTSGKQRTAEEVAQEQAKMDREAEALLMWQTYAPSRAAFEAAVKGQGGMCGRCGGTLDASPIKHWLDGKVLCRACSPLKPRYGSGA